MQKTIKTGIIGCGLMGCEFASAAARWCHLGGEIARPEITAVCNRSPEPMEWFKRNVPTVTQTLTDYRDLLSIPEIELIYCAVPHDRHERIYTDILRAGKHLMGEKPFGIDLAANESIMAEINKHPELFVRCSSEYPYYPGCQQLIKWAEEGRFGRIMEVRAGLCHSSDMDVDKPINWKRTVDINGEYGCMGDLGIHTLHVPLRLGWTPVSVFAKLSDIIRERPDGKGGMAACETWDNATLICDARDSGGNMFPMYLETKRMAPGCTDRWYIEVDGLDCSAKFATTDPNAFHYTQSWGREQAWCRLELGHKTMLKTVSGGIFEFGFSDSILQMWGAFMSEFDGNKPYFGCFTPEEAAVSHRLYTAAIESRKKGALIEI